MQVMAGEEMAGLISACLPGLEEIEAAYIQNCWLREPPVPVGKFSKEWHLSAKRLAELRSRVLVRLKTLMAKKGFTSVADFL